MQTGGHKARPYGKGRSEIAASFVFYLFAE